MREKSVEPQLTWLLKEDLVSFIALYLCKTSFLIKWFIGKEQAVLLLRVPIGLNKKIIIILFICLFIYSSKRTVMLVKVKIYKCVKLFKFDHFISL